MTIEHDMPFYQNFCATTSMLLNEHMTQQVLVSSSLFTILFTNKFRN